MTIFTAAQLIEISRKKQQYQKPENPQAPVSHCICRWCKRETASPDIARPTAASR